MENYRLKVFRTAAEQLSFRKAAEILNISQPAVSQHIHALEEDARAPLFDRRGNSIALTAAGLVLLRYAREVSDTMARAMKELASLQGQAGGRLRLGASTTVAQYILPRILGLFTRQNPAIQVSVVSGNTDAIVQWLCGEEIDFGLIEGPTLRRGIKIEKFVEDVMVLIVNPDHPWAQAGRISPHALRAAPMLLRERGSGSRRVVERALTRQKVSVKSLQVAMELDSTEAIVSGVEVGLGVGFVSQWAIAKELKLGTVLPVAVDGMVIQRDFSFVRLTGPDPSGTAGAFRKFALDQVGRLRR